MPTDWLIPDGDGTLNSWTGSGTGGGAGTAPYFDNIDDYSTTDGSGTHDSDVTYVTGPNKTNASAFFTLDATSASFDPAAGLTVVAKVAYRLDSAGVSGTADTLTLALQVFKSDEATALTDEVFVNNGAKLPASYTLQNVTLTASDPASQTKADWDGARIRFRQVYVQQSGADTTARARVTGFALGVTFTPAPPQMTSVTVSDSDRDFATSTTNLNVTVSRNVRKSTGSPYAVGDTIPGFTVSTREGPTPASKDLPVTYVSGNLDPGGAGTSTFVVKVPVLIPWGLVTELSYDSTATGSEIEAQNDAQEELTETQTVASTLTKRVRRILYGPDGRALASTSVKWALCEFADGIATNYQVGGRADKGTATTTSTGLLDVQYTGPADPGATVYLYALHGSSNSFAWPAVVD